MGVNVPKSVPKTLVIPPEAGIRLHGSKYNGFPLICQLSYQKLRGMTV